MKIRTFLRKVKSAFTEVEIVLGYTANHQESSPAHAAHASYERIYTPPASPKPKGRITRPKQPGSTTSYQWLPANLEYSSPARPLLTVRNPDLDPTTHFPGEDLTEAYASNDSDDSDEEIIDIDRANRFFFERPSSRLAQAIEEDHDEIFGDGFIAIISETLSQASSSSRESFPTSPLGNTPAIPFGRDSTEHVAKRPDQHVSWNLPSPSKDTFLQRMAKKLSARASSRKEPSRASCSDHQVKSHSRERTPSPYPGSSRERASHRYRDPRCQSSREVHKPRPILKSSIGRPQPQTPVHELGPSQPFHELGPSQPKTLVHKKGYRNLTTSVPIITVTPPNNPTLPLTTIRDFLHPPENLNVLPDFLHRNLSRSQSSQITYPLTVVGISESLTSQSDALDFANLSTISKAGPSNSVSASSGQSQVFATAPGSPIIPARGRSPPSSLRLSTPVKYRDPNQGIEARCAAKRAEAESLNKKLEQVKRELGKFEAILREKKSLHSPNQREDEVGE